MQGRDITSPVEADLILDEHTAIIFHPLGDLGQAIGLDVEGGLKTLVATLARIGPRYKNLWLIFEEYYSPAYLAMDEIPFETQVLFASDERYAARMVRAIAEGIVRRIDRPAKEGIRRDEDGWQDAEEWLWRDWLNDQDSTHERFLGAFRIFNPFSIQLILSLCSLKEFFAMEHQQRCKTVGRFVDPSVLAIFDKVVATPMS
ncbi:hypothetical protein BGZ47_009098 [Haplosporangium gracile]|nr:hypothetical protein BGZ47_009098 [Haplosporangium gracile]